MANRKEVTDFIVNTLAEFTPGNTYNSDLARSRLDKMSDREFDSYIKSLAKPDTEEGRKDQEIIPFYVPNLSKDKVTMEQLMKVADKVGLPLFERLWLTDPQTGTVYLTPQKYLVIDLLVRRQAQMLTKKSSIPSDTRSTDHLTAQVTGKSKGSKMSFPEVAAQLAQGLTATLTEEIKVRGGDRVAQVEFERQLIEHGEASIEVATSAGTLTKSTTVLAILLRSMLINNNLDEV